jgi:predicted enzyme related to lactoylglutathione lyase
MTVTETFFAVEVDDMDRATAFYVQALGAAVLFASPRWSSLRIAGVRLGLALRASPATTKVGLHFVVTDLGAARAGVERSGGRIVAAALEPAPGVLIAEVSDTEGNTFTLTQGAA